MATPTTVDADKNSRLDVDASLALLPTFAISALPKDLVRYRELLINPSTKKNHSRQNFMSVFSLEVCRHDAQNDDVFAVIVSFCSPVHSWRLSAGSDPQPPNRR